MSREARRFQIRGELLKLVTENLIERLEWLEACNNITKKYGFEEYFSRHTDIVSGGQLIGFGSPSKDTDLSKFLKPKKGAYYPRAREGKEIQADVDNMKKWSLKKIWDYLDYQPHPFGGNGGYYQDGKLDDELLFYSYDAEFKGHADLKELKLSEYYKMIGE